MKYKGRPGSVNIVDLRNANTLQHMTHAAASEMAASVNYAKEAVGMQTKLTLPANFGKAPRPVKRNGPR